METEKERDGFDRRQFLRRAAVAGAAAAWAAPVVKTVVGTPAFASNVPAKNPMVRPTTPSASSAERISIHT